jgi:iron complex outermembrane receptor protein
VVRAELFATRVNDYPVLARVPVGAAMVQTYGAVDALLAGGSVRAEWELVSAAATWNWGEQVDSNTPLAEIQPLSLDLGLRSPQWRGCAARAWYRHATAQHRVDPSQGETPTGSWNRLDLAAAYEAAGVRYELALDNATNVLYTQHLSFQRNPFAAGLRVWEPGRTLRLTAAFAF